MNFVASLDDTPADTALQAEGSAGRYVIARSGLHLLAV